MTYLGQGECGLGRPATGSERLTVVLLSGTGVPRLLQVLPQLLVPDPPGPPPGASPPASSPGSCPRARSSGGPAGARWRSRLLRPQPATVVRPGGGGLPSLPRRVVAKSAAGRGLRAGKCFAPSKNGATRQNEKSRVRIIWAATRQICWTPFPGGSRGRSIRSLPARTRANLRICCPAWFLPCFPPGPPCQSRPAWRPAPTDSTMGATIAG